MGLGKRCVFRLCRRFVDIMISGGLLLFSTFLSQFMQQKPNHRQNLQKYLHYAGSKLWYLDKLTRVIDL